MPSLCHRVIADGWHVLSHDRLLDLPSYFLTGLATSLPRLLEHGTRARHEETANFLAGPLEEYDALSTFCDVNDIEIPLTSAKRPL